MEFENKHTQTHIHAVVDDFRVNEAATSNCEGEEFKRNYITTLRGQYV